MLELWDGVPAVEGPMPVDAVFPYDADLDEPEEEECPPAHEGERQTTLPQTGEPCLLLLEVDYNEDPIKQENTLFVELQQCLP